MEPHERIQLNLEILAVPALLLVLTGLATLSSPVVAKASLFYDE